MLTVEEWMVILARADATHCSDSMAVARTVMQWLDGGGRPDCARCAQQGVANAFVAYARMLHKAGVDP